LFQTVDVSFYGALVAGLVSFISPCVLPLIPGYLSFISGVTIDELHTGSRKDNLVKVLKASLFFVLGFSTVFIALGAGASSIGTFLGRHKDLFNYVAGVLIFLFGVHMSGLFKFGFLNYEKRFHSSSKPLGLIGSYIVGLAFAFGWTPCIGPILAAILTIAANEGSLGKGMLLLSVYSLGLALPFLLAAVFFNTFLGFFSWIKKHFHTIELVSGILLMAVGVLVFTGYLQQLSTLLLKLFPGLQDVG
jgi:cytochrome c-type biogenesis protein